MKTDTFKRLAVAGGLVALFAGAALTAHGTPMQGRSQLMREATMDASQLASLRGATARFHRVEAALAEGYVPFGGCFSSPTGEGAMGYHYVHNALVEDPAIDPLRPELLVYEAGPGGQMRLVAVEWITFVAAWHQAGHIERPSLFGQEFHVNPTLLDEPFYLLHAWIWKHNPSGMFKDWNPTVRCE
jgi:hypothetical protein